MRLTTDIRLLTLSSRFLETGGNGIAMGDGITQFFGTVGLEDIGPDFVLSHELAHHIQYEMNLLGGEQTPENTRKAELMADYLATYFSAHPKGGVFDEDGLFKGAASAFNVGDCSFESNGHHGTPNQREEAVLLAVDLIASTRDNERILSTGDVVASFNEIYDDLLAPDAV